ncbi:hypothetical protein [Dethiosulfovibrio salsuginis]|uniref:Uncharacterized protein n=1 Tax=Dethiosulfovibrio salsuginis TaxID=561720 RepID=A0A1X7JNZ9_9BACT|nr:hypothetical protein [Dethiosulfovibrio salsuginis]SMG29613.1 hypothetical protein SAMN06275492_11412 [Dethiosulfovibrio salsuginis]
MLRGLLVTVVALCSILTGLGEPAWALSSVAVETYLVKVLLAVALLGAIGALLVRWGPRFRRASGSGLEVLTSLPLGRGVIYVVRFCSEVILLGETKTGYTVLGRYRAEQWEELYGVDEKKDIFH